MKLGESWGMPAGPPAVRSRSHAPDPLLDRQVGMLAAVATPPRPGSRRYGDFRPATRVNFLWGVLLEERGRGAPRGVLGGALPAGRPVPGSGRSAQGRVPLPRRRAAGCAGLTLRPRTAPSGPSVSPLRAPFRSSRSPPAPLSCPHSPTSAAPAGRLLGLARALPATQKTLAKRKRRTREESIWRKAVYDGYLANPSCQPDHFMYSGPNGR